MDYERKKRYLSAKMEMIKTDICIIEKFYATLDDLLFYRRIGMLDESFWREILEGSICG